MRRRPSTFAVLLAWLGAVVVLGFIALLLLGSPETTRAMFEEIAKVAEQAKLAVNSKTSAGKAPEDPSSADSTFDDDPDFPKIPKAWNQAQGADSKSPAAPGVPSNVSIADAYTGYTVAYKELKRRGFAKATTLSTLSMIQDRISLVDHLDQSVTTLESAIRSRGTPQQGETLDKVLQACALDHQTCAVVREMLALLQSHYGSWKIDISQKVLFADSSQSGAYNTLSYRFAQLVTQAQAIKNTYATDAR